MHGFTTFNLAVDDLTDLIGQLSEHGILVWMPPGCYNNENGAGHGKGRDMTRCIIMGLVNPTLSMAVLTLPSAWLV